MRKLDYKVGQVLNKHGISYVMDTDPIFENTRKRRACLFQCECGNKFKSTLSDVRSNKRTSCGCKKGHKPKYYKEGEYINGVKFIKTIGTINYQQRAVFECPICKNHWESSVNNIQAGHSKSCCGVKRGWSRSQWVKLSKTSKLYKVRLYNETESFIKIGITTKEIKYRFLRFPYKYEVLKLIEGDSGYIFDLENRTKRVFKKYKYKPLISFKGETECYINK